MFFFWRADVSRASIDGKLRFRVWRRCSGLLDEWFFHRQPAPDFLPYWEFDSRGGRVRSGTAANVGDHGRDPQRFLSHPVVDKDLRPGVIARLIVFFIVLSGASVPSLRCFASNSVTCSCSACSACWRWSASGYLFATAIGFVQIAPRSTNDEIAKAFADSMAQGLLLTDLKGQVVYANQAYADMTGATIAADIKTVEAPFRHPGRRRQSSTGWRPASRMGWTVTGVSLSQSIRESRASAPAGTG